MLMNEIGNKTLDHSEPLSKPTISALAYIFRTFLACFVTLHPGLLNTYRIQIQINTELSVLIPFSVRMDIGWNLIAVDPQVASHQLQLSKHTGSLRLSYFGQADVLCRLVPRSSQHSLHHICCHLCRFCPSNCFCFAIANPHSSKNTKAFSLSSPSICFLCSFEGTIKWN